MRIKFDENTVWKFVNNDKAKLYLAGVVFFKDEKLNIKKLLHLLIGLKNLQELCDLTTDFKGQFSFIFENSYFKVAYTDKIRSFPISKYKSNNLINVSNSTRHFDTIKHSFSLNKEAIEVFSSSGYTIGNETFYKGFEILEAGSFIFFNKASNEIVQKKYASFFNDKSLKFKEEDLFEKIDNVITTSIKKLIKIADGKQIVIPLSAGLDSRLILGKLVELGYQNILTFTYGPKNIWERKIAEKCAKHLNVPWYFVELNRKVKKRYYTKDRIDYYKFSSNNNSVPHIADYYALNILKENGVLNFKKSIIVNGQTGDFITGGHIPVNINEISLEDIYDVIINKHFALWFNKFNPKFNSFIKQVLKSNYKLEPYFSNKDILFKEYEKFECDERQIKYVINGQRIYDWLGIDWYLPLWSDEMFDLWSSLDIKHKINQNAYNKYCETYNPGNAFDVKLDGNTLSLPLYFYPILALLKFTSKLNKKKKYSRLKKTYLSFYEKYYPFYPQKTYLEYLKDAKHHRSPVSYWVNSYIFENKLKK